MSERLRRGWISGLLVVAGFALRWFLVHIHPAFAGDSLVYGDLAKNMLLHHVYGFSEAGTVRPTLIRLPGYPVFLAGCFTVFGLENYAAAVWVQVVVDLVGWWWLSRLAGRLFGERAGLAALALGMLCPFTANYTAVALTETLVMFCAIVAMVGLERWMASGAGWSAWLWVIAVALMYGAMLRPDQVLFAVVIVVAMGWVSWKRAAWMPLGVMCVVMAVPFLLWGVRNERVMHVFQPLAPRFANDPGEGVTLGFNKWYRTWAIDFKATNDVYWNWDGDAVLMGDLAPRAIDNEQQRRETQRILDLYALRERSTPELEAALMRLADERVKAHPWRYYVYVPAMKVVNMWLRPRTELTDVPLDWWNFRAHERASWEALGLAVWCGVYLVLGVVGVWMWRSEGWGVMGWICVTFVVLRCMLLWTIDNSEPRYTLECFPMVMLFGAFVFRKRRAATVAL